MMHQWGPALTQLMGAVQPRPFAFSLFTISSLHLNRMFANHFVTGMWGCTMYKYVLSPRPELIEYDGKKGFCLA
jgi:hypothetical protein